MLRDKAFFLVFSSSFFILIKMKKHVYIYIFSLYSGRRLSQYNEDDFRFQCWFKGVDSLRHKLWFSNPYIFETQCRKPLLFQTYIIWSNRTHSLKYQRFTTLEFKDIGIGKSELVAKTQFLKLLNNMDTYYR